MDGTFLLQSVSPPHVEFRLAAAVTVLGRSAACDVIVRHPSVSRKHAELHVGGDDVTVADLGSRNGTYLDDRPVSSGPVRPGQVLRFGTVAFRLVAGGDVPDEDREEE